jgi:hypothetical protein
MGAIKIGGPDLAEATDVTTLDNDVVVTGTFAGSADFNVSESGDDLTANGNLNAFVARYTEAGALRWVKTFGPGDNQIGETISRLSDGNILVCGTFMTTITLGSTTLTSAGNVDVFFARLDGSGHVVSAGRVGGDQEDLTPLATTSGTTAIIVGGAASDDLVFPGGIHRKKIGSFDGFILQQP